MDKYIKLSQALEVLDSCSCWWAHDRMERIPAADVVERKVLDQVYWERDTALHQLAEIGKGLGEKMDDVQPVVLCQDCEYCRKVDEFEHWCGGFGSPARLVKKDDFCSHGKAKE